MPSALQTSDVVAVLIRIGPALVMRINTAAGAEVMLGGVRIEFIHLQHTFALDNRDSCQRHRGHDRAFAAAERPSVG